MATYTLQDLEKARIDLQKWIDRFENYSGNNPNKYQTDIKSARQRVRQIEYVLKIEGVFPNTENEELQSILDRFFPAAQNKEIVEHEGQRYERRFRPSEKSRSGKSVKSWERYWVKLSDRS